MFIPEAAGQCIQPGCLQRVCQRLHGIRRGSPAYFLQSFFSPVHRHQCIRFIPAVCEFPFQFLRQPAQRRCFLFVHGGLVRFCRSINFRGRLRQLFPQRPVMHRLLIPDVRDQQRGCAQAAGNQSRRQHQADGTRPDFFEVQMFQRIACILKLRIPHFPGNSIIMGRQRFQCGNSPFL